MRKAPLSFITIANALVAEDDPLPDQGRRERPEVNPQPAPLAGVSLDDFYAYLPTHTYICRADRASCGRGERQLGCIRADSSGRCERRARAQEERGNPKTITASSVARPASRRSSR